MCGPLRLDTLLLELYVYLIIYLSMGFGSLRIQNLRGISKAQYVVSIGVYRVWWLSGRVRLGGVGRAKPPPM